MARYTIIRIYEVPARDRIEATDQLMHAIELHREKVFHVSDVIRLTDDRKARGRSVRVEPYKGWLGTLFAQLTGR